MSLSLSPLIRFGTSTWAYEGWQGQVYKRQYAKSAPDDALVFCIAGEWEGVSRLV